MNRPLSSIASAAVRAFQVGHSQDEAPVPANLPKWFHAQISRPSTANSKSVASGYSAIASIHRGHCPLIVVQENRAARRRVPDCIGLRRSKDQGNGPRLCAAAEICKRRIAGHGELPRVSSPPRWISSNALASDEGFIGQWFSPSFTAIQAPL
jgi:hypothetical protein